MDWDGEFGDLLYVGMPAGGRVNIWVKLPMAVADLTNVFLEA